MLIMTLGLCDLILFILLVVACMKELEYTVHLDFTVAWGDESNKTRVLLFSLKPVNKIY